MRRARVAFVVRGMLAASPLALGAAPAAAQLAVRAETVYTMAGPVLRDGVVLVGASGKIERVGSVQDVRVPDGYRTLQAKVVTPGLIDAHAVIGLAGYLNQPHDQDQLERSDPIQPSLRAIDAYNAREKLVEWVREFGVTTIHTGHGPGALVSGQTLIAKTRGETVDEAVIDTFAAVAMTLGPEVSQAFNNRPGSRARGVAMLRSRFVEARNYAQKRARTTGEPTPRNLDSEVLLAVLDRSVPALITAQRSTEILSALRLQKEFGFELVLDGAAEAYLVTDEIRAAGVPVILHPTMARQAGTLENATFETAKKLREAGIPVALQSGYESYVPKTRVVLFEAAMAASYGLPFEQALASITIDAARILGIDGRVGSLEPGKDGDLALFDGDPFEFTSHVCEVLIEGVVVKEGCR